jgi:hypothetical protein
MSSQAIFDAPPGTFLEIVIYPPPLPYSFCLSFCLSLSLLFQDCAVHTGQRAVHQG